MKIFYKNGGWKIRPIRLPGFVIQQQQEEASENISNCIARMNQVKIKRTILK